MSLHHGVFVPSFHLAKIVNETVDFDDDPLAADQTLTTLSIVILSVDVILLSMSILSTLLLCFCCDGDSKKQRRFADECRGGCFVACGREENREKKALKHGVRCCPPRRFKEVPELPEYPMLMLVCCSKGVKEGCSCFGRRRMSGVEEEDFEKEKEFDLIISVVVLLLFRLVAWLIVCSTDIGDKIFWGNLVNSSAYFTNWAYVLLDLYYLFSAICTALFLVLRIRFGKTETISTKNRLLQGLNCLDWALGLFFGVVGSLAIAVCVAYWLVSLPVDVGRGSYEFVWSSLFEHLVNAVLVLIEFLCVSETYRPKWSSLCIAVGIVCIYLIWATMIVKTALFPHYPYGGLLSYDVYHWAIPVRYLFAVIPLVGFGILTFLAGVKWGVGQLGWGRKCCRTNGHGD